MYLSLNIQYPQSERSLRAALRPNFSWQAVGNDMPHRSDKYFTVPFSCIGISLKKDFPTC